MRAAVVNRGGRFAVVTFPFLHDLAAEAIAPFVEDALRR